MTDAMKFFALSAALFAPANITAAAEDQPKFTITISAPSAVVRSGDRIRIHVVLTNISQQTISEPRSPNPSLAEMFYRVKIQDKTGKDAAETPYGHSAKNYRFSGSMFFQTIQPGGKMEEDTFLEKQADMTTPGEYTVQLSRPASDDPKGSMVTSNKVTITVTP